MVAYVIVSLLCLLFSIWFVYNVDILKINTVTVPIYRSISHVDWIQLVIYIICFIGGLNILLVIGMFVSIFIHMTALERDIDEIIPSRKGFVYRIFKRLEN